jgi:NitT/TauT family transport system substrate-binding protein/putative hydroxymethylpyrimidine transport system substrate-binding protein
MRRVVASLAAVLASLALASCGGDGAEPGALKRATLVLDFTPNAVHSGIYEARSKGRYRSQGVDLQVQPPSASSDAPKLLQSGSTDFAILDIHDLGIARERGLPLVGIAAIVQRPLAAVIARDDGSITRPRDLQGATVGVTGLPSDDAVVDSEVQADGVDPSAVDRVTIGFNAVTDLAAGKVDAATGFWNAEAVALDALLAANPSLDRDEQRAELRLLLPAFSPPGRLRAAVLRKWAAWDHSHGILDRRIDPDDAFGGSEYKR